ncbi:MAG TPA: hypothetical protein DEF88_04370 [Porphyromonadaceae bacterium]|nr:hypothetical protein [Porphyromonadaceae bacterium]
MRKYLGIIVALLTLVSCGENLEDTYKDYAGEGEIRYLGKCSDLSVKPGWNRLIVNWTNSVDPVIDKIKITWTKEDMVKEQLLEKGTSEFSIPDLEDGNYEITICSVDKEGNTSLTNTVYGRPYTEAHETIQTFTRIVSRHFFMKDRLILFFLGWEDNVEEAYLTYTKKNGSAGRLDLTKDIVNRLYYLLPDAIDTSKPIELYRTGYIVGCEDKIIFSPTALEKSRLFNADFKQEMKRQFGFDPDIPDNWAESVEELYLDWSIGSFADLLNLPNLKKLVLGKHRYILDELVNDTQVAQSKVFETAISNFVLETLHELNGLTVERYNKHYPGLTEAPYIENKGQTTAPDYSFLDLTDLTFTSVPEDEGDYKSYLEYLTDGNVNTSWEPYVMSQATTITLELDLKEVKSLKGLKLVQTYFEEAYKEKRAKSPNLLRIFVSEDLRSWENATYLEEIVIGNSSGEVNIIPFVEGGKQARYVQVVVTTPLYVRNYEVTMAEIGLY